MLDVGRDVTATLRAQEHGHQPVICFEPGIMSRDCSAGNRAYEGVCSTLRAQMGDNQPAVCYVIDSHPSDSRFRIDGGGGTVPTVTRHIHKGSADGPLVLIENESLCDREPSCGQQSED